MNEARPASIRRGRPASSAIENSPDGSNAACVPFSWIRGTPFPFSRASRMVIPLVSGTLLMPLRKTSPSSSTVPRIASFSTRSFRSAC